MMGNVPAKHMGLYLKPTCHRLASDFMTSDSHAHKEEFYGLGFVIKGCKLQKNCVCLLCIECPDHLGSEFPFFFSPPLLPVGRDGNERMNVNSNVGVQQCCFCSALTSFPALLYEERNTEET
ncbi:hypothetical protein E2320_010215 [Naja naja]|nr:hypothetical protein E2320_010215 [Naja naja]